MHTPSMNFMGLLVLTTALWNIGVWISAFVVVVAFLFFNQRTRLFVPETSLWNVCIRITAFIIVIASLLPDIGEDWGFAEPSLWNIRVGIATFVVVIIAQLLFYLKTVPLIHVTALWNISVGISKVIVVSTYRHQIILMQDVYSAE
jgi:hypothetical protein